MNEIGKTYSYTKELLDQRNKAEHLLLRFYYETQIHPENKKRMIEEYFEKTDHNPFTKGENKI